MLCVIQSFFFLLTDILKNSFQDADLRVENLENTTTKLEQELEAAEKRNEELKELYKTAKEEMDEMERQLEVV